jgi:U3 small nucleolar RNA-associated protein 12
MVSKQTTDTMMAGERIIEALDLADNERVAFKEYEDAMSRLSPDDGLRLQPPPRNPVLAAYDMEPEEYVLNVVERVQSTALHDALLVLPFSKVVSLMVYLNIWAQRVRCARFLPKYTPKSCTQNLNIVLVSRLIFFLLKTHHHQIVANRLMRVSLIPLRQHLRASLQLEKRVIGYNLAALNHIRRKNEQNRSASYYEAGLDEEQVRAKISEGKKRKRISMKA